MITVKELAEKLACPYSGNGDILIKGIVPLEDADEGFLCFIDKKEKLKGLHINASAIIVPKGVGDIENFSGILIESDNPRMTLMKALGIFEDKENIEAGVAPTVQLGNNVKIGKNVAILDYTVIGDNCDIGDNAIIYPNCTIGQNVKIGPDTIIHPNVTLYSRSIIGARVLLEAGVVIGTSGFGYAEVNGLNTKIPQIGNVVIEDDVDVGANSTIHRSTMGSTKIKRGVKIGNQVEIAHNVTIGENSILVSQVGISGSTKIGKNCVLAGQVGIADHAVLEDNVKIGAKSGVSSVRIKEGSVYFGIPARPINKRKRIEAVISRLPEIYRKVNMLEKKIEQSINEEEKENDNGY